MEKNSFVFHFEYLHDIPEELRGQWAVNIIDYAETGIEPVLNSWMEQKLWNSIKTRIDSECQKYQSKVANLKQNSRKNLHSIEKRFSDTENAISDTENQFSETEKEKSVSENQKSDTENDFSVGVYVFDSVSVSVSDNDSVIESEFGKGYKADDKSSAPHTTQSDSKTEKPKKARKKAEVDRPTINDVIEYCRQQNYTINPERFWKYYEDTGWGVRVFNTDGKCVSYKPIKDWKSKCDDWQKRQIEFKSYSKSPPVSNNQNVDEFEDYFRQKEGLENATDNNNGSSEFPNF